MRAVFFIAALGLLSQFVKAQDTIQRVDGTIQLVRIIETTPSMVRYVPIENPDGPIFSITKQAISKIVFEDGRSVFYRRLKDPYESSKLTQPESLFSRNIVSLNIYDFLWGITSISYERLSPSRTFGLKMPLSIRLLNRETDSHYWSKIYSTGIGINYYPFKQEQVTWYLGLSVSFNDYREGSGGTYAPKNVTIWETGPYTGFFFRISKNFELSSQIGLIMRSQRVRTRLYYVEEFLGSVPIEINVCLKF